MVNGHQQKNFVYHILFLYVYYIDIDWNKVSIFVYRESCGKTRMCRPCPSCMKALKDRGIKHIYYTSENGYNYERL